jgi:hypothetical protein
MVEFGGVTKEDIFSTLEGLFEVLEAIGKETQNKVSIESKSSSSTI